MELWRIVNWLTGVDYVHLNSGVTQCIRRVRYTHIGRAYVRWYGAEIIWLDSPDRWTITPLTAPKATMQ